LLYALFEYISESLILIVLPYIWVIFLFTLNINKGLLFNKNKVNLKQANTIFTFNFYPLLANIYVFMFLSECAISTLTGLNVGNVVDAEYYLVTLLIIISSILFINKWAMYKSILGFVVINIILIAPSLYAINSLLMVYFIIEVISLLIFLKIATSLISKSRANVRELNITSTEVGGNSFKNYKTALFYVYWSSFFFSTIFFITLLAISKLYTFLEFDLLALLPPVLNIDNPVDLLTKVFIGEGLALALLIKLSLPPLYIIKIEIYKGLPLTITLIYSILLIIIYVLFFLFLLEYLPELFLYTTITLKYLFLLTIPVLVILLYIETNIKSFFAFSSILNIVLPMLIIISN